MTGFGALVGMPHPFAVGLGEDGSERTLIVFAKDEAAQAEAIAAGGCTR